MTHWDEHRGTPAPAQLSSPSMWRPVSSNKQGAKSAEKVINEGRIGGLYFCVWRDHVHTKGYCWSEGTVRQWWRQEFSGSRRWWPGVKPYWEWINLRESGEGEFDYRTSPALGHVFRSNYEATCSRFKILNSVTKVSKEHGTNLKHLLCWTTLPRKVNSRRAADRGELREGDNVVHVRTWPDIPIRWWG